MDRQAFVDLGAITANVAALCELVRGSQVMAVVKADGYGHGMVPAARAALAGGASWLGVADLAEAVALRQAGITAPRAVPDDLRRSRRGDQARRGPHGRLGGVRREDRGRGRPGSASGPGCTSRPTPG